MKKQIAIINWIDSTLHGTDSYEPDDPILKPLTAVSVGIVVRKDKNSITLAIDSWDTGEYRNCETICNRQINSVKYLNLNKKGKK